MVRKKYIFFFCNRSSFFPADIHEAKNTTRSMKIFAVIVAILALVSLSTSQVDNTNFPLLFVLPARVINTTGQVCPPDQVRVSEKDKIAQDVRDLLRTATGAPCQASFTQSSPATSCSTLPTNCPSGYYWIRSSNGSAVQVYCDIDRVCGCNDTGGWTRVAFLNTTDPNQQCPGEWMLQNEWRLLRGITETRRLCGGNSSSHLGCVSATYNTYGISYSHVCGRVIGYQFAVTDAFRTSNSSIDSHYLSGVSLTHGPPGARQHIWSFAAGFGEGNTGQLGCPCANRLSALARVPSFVRNDFFCESGNPVAFSVTHVLYPDDPLWDGEGCGSPPCCELSYPPGVTAPWFCKHLPQTTTDDIEARICHSYDDNDEDTPVELVELYIR